MISEVRPEAAAVHGRLHRFMEDVVYPNERVYVEQHAAPGCGTCGCRRATTAPG